MWKTPQAAAWAREPWRHHAVAMWVRTAVACVGSEATAADKNSLHRFVYQIPGRFTGTQTPPSGKPGAAFRSGGLGVLQRPNDLRLCLEGGPALGSAAGGM